MNAEYQTLSRYLKLDDTGGAPANTVTIPFHSGSPYRHLTVWARVVADGTINVDFQPRFIGVDEGSAVNVATTTPTKIFQAGVDEIRPPSSSSNLKKHPDDEAPALLPLFEMVVINSSATVPVVVHLYMTLAASPGGA